MTPAPRTSDDPDPARLLARAGWLHVSDRILSGVCHDLNGRVSSLDGLVQLLRLDGAEDTPVIPYLREEVAKLESVVSLLRLIPGELMAEPEPITPGELLERVARLHRTHRGLEAIETVVSYAEGLPPLLVSWPRVGRSLLVLSAWAAHAARTSGGRSIELRAEAAGESVVLRLTAGEEGRALPALGAEASAPAVDALRGLLEMDGGELEIDLGDGTISVRLPSLSDLRRRG